MVEVESEAVEQKTPSWLYQNYYEKLSMNRDIIKKNMTTVMMWWCNSQPKRSVLTDIVFGQPSYQGVNDRFNVVERDINELTSTAIRLIGAKEEIPNIESNIESQMRSTCINLVDFARNAGYPHKVHCYRLME